MRRFEYLAAASVADAVAALERHGPEASPFAGGTDLLVEMREGLRRPRLLVDLKTAPGLRELACDAETGLRIGASVTARALERSGAVQRRYRGLWQAVRELGSIQVRNRATLAGNVCRASPSADTLPPLIADRARVTIAGPSGERDVPVEEFCAGPGTTVLSAGEIVTRIVVPPPPAGCGKAYLKHGRRRAMELATVGVAVALVERGGVCREARIALGAVAPTPIRARRAEALLEGRALDDRAIDEAAACAMRESSPIDDVRASAEYRRKMVRVLARRAIRLAREAAA